MESRKYESFCQGSPSADTSTHGKQIMLPLTNLIVSNRMEQKHASCSVFILAGSFCLVNNFRTKNKICSEIESKGEMLTKMNSNENKNKKTLTQIGWKISKIRQNMGLTQEEFADKIGYARTTLAKLEAGLRDIKSSEIVDLAQKLDVSCDYLLGRTMAAAPDNIVQEMVDRYGLSESTLKTLRRLKEFRKKEEEFMYGNLLPSENWEQVITRPDIKEHMEHDDRILEMLNLLFETKRNLDDRANETHGEYLLYTLYKYLKEEDGLGRAIKIAMLHEDIMLFWKNIG